MAGRRPWLTARVLKNEAAYRYGGASVSTKDSERHDIPKPNEEPQHGAPPSVPRRDDSERDRVQEADEESFPASDPPSWSPLTPNHKE